MDGLRVDFTLAKYGAGSADVSLSRSKCEDAVKIVDAASAKDQDVTKASSVIFMAGYQAELIAADKNATLKPNRRYADPDYHLAIAVPQSSSEAIAFRWRDIWVRIS